jgi:hypothetical protein
MPSQDHTQRDLGHARRESGWHVAKHWLPLNQAAADPARKELNANRGGNDEPHASAWVAIIADP